MLAAGDTFRAAAIEQLKIWGVTHRRAVIAEDRARMPASIAYDALVSGASRGAADVLIVDTAGPPAEPRRVDERAREDVRVLKKVDATAPHAVLLVLDATVGQNALIAGRGVRPHRGSHRFGDDQARRHGAGRHSVSRSPRSSGLPVHFIGVGEGVDDLSPFSAHDFGRALAGLNQLGRINWTRAHDC